jgi:LmbE family N-acetylglucosaminyl deacetylase
MVRLFHKFSRGMKLEEEIYPYAVRDFSAENALVIAPHPDDESIGCGGSIARHTKAGSRVKVIFLTDGSEGDFEGRFGPEYVAVRRECALKALHHLGVEEYEFWHGPDRQLQRMEGEFVRSLISAVRFSSSSLVYAPSPFELHPDHRSAFSFAWRLSCRIPVKLLLYEALVPLYPDTLVDISREWPEKRRAIESYWTELEYNDYLSKMEGLNRFRTMTLGAQVSHAEAFLLIDKGRSAGNTSLQTRIFKVALSEGNL